RAAAPFRPGPEAGRRSPRRAAAARGGRPHAAFEAAAGAEAAGRREAHQPDQEVDDAHAGPADPQVAAAAAHPAPHVLRRSAPANRSGVQLLIRELGSATKARSHVFVLRGGLETGLAGGAGGFWGGTAV